MYQHVCFNNTITSQTLTLNILLKDLVSILFQKFIVDKNNLHANYLTNLNLNRALQKVCGLIKNYTHFNLIKILVRLHSNLLLVQYLATILVA